MNYPHTFKPDMTIPLKFRFCYMQKGENGVHSFLIHSLECTTKYTKSTVNTQYPDCYQANQTVCQDNGVCKTFPKLQCDIKFREEEVVMPETACENVPVEVCGPRMCPLKRGEDICRDEVQQVSIYFLCKTLKMAG